MNRQNGTVYYMSKGMIIFLFIYYFVLLLIGGIVSVVIAKEIASEMEGRELLIKTFYVSIAVSGMLCSIQYIRRIYKACISGRIDYGVDESTKKIGTFAYFFFRPFFAFAFSIIMVFSMLSGMFVVTGNLDYILNDKFAYVCIILSSFLGYSIGKFMDRFGDISVEKISIMQ